MTGKGSGWEYLQKASLGIVYGLVASNNRLPQSGIFQGLSRFRSLFGPRTIPTRLEDGDRAQAPRFAHNCASPIPDPYHVTQSSYSQP
jgi:hypothetical protein